MDSNGVKFFSDGCYLIQHPYDRTYRTNLREDGTVQDSCDHRRLPKWVTWV